MTSLLSAIDIIFLTVKVPPNLECLQMQNKNHRIRKKIENINLTGMNEDKI